MERGRAVGRLISLVSPDAILGFDYLLLNDYTREVSAQRDVVYGVIVDPQGKPMSSYVDESDPLIRKALSSMDSKDTRQLLQRLDPEEVRLRQFRIIKRQGERMKRMVGGAWPLRPTSVSVGHSVSTGARI